MHHKEWLISMCMHSQKICYIGYCHAVVTHIAVDKSLMMQMQKSNDADADGYASICVGHHGQ